MTEYKQTQTPFKVKALLTVSMLLGIGAFGMSALDYYSGQSPGGGTTVARSEVNTAIDDEIKSQLEAAEKVASVLQLADDKSSPIVCGPDQVLYTHDRGVSCAALQGASSSLATTESGIQGPPGPRGQRGQQGVQGPQGIMGLQGEPGAGLPTGGLGGQVPIKLSNSNYDVGWADLPEVPDTLAFTVNGQSGNVTLSSNDISEGPDNLYFTNQRAVDALNDTLNGYLPISGGTIGGDITINNSAITIGTTSDSFDTVLYVKRNNSNTGRIDNNGNGMRLQALSNTLYLRAPNNKGITISDSGLEFESNVNSDIEFDSSGNGVILRSPDGTRWRVQIGNDGTVSATSL